MTNEGEPERAELHHTVRCTYTGEKHPVYPAVGLQWGPRVKKLTCVVLCDLVWFSSRVLACPVSAVARLSAWRSNFHVEGFAGRRAGARPRSSRSNVTLVYSRSIYIYRMISEIDPRESARSARVGSRMPRCLEKRMVVSPRVAGFSCR